MLLGGVNIQDGAFYGCSNLGGNLILPNSLTSIGDFAFNDSDPEKMTAYDKYMYDNYYSVGTADDPYAGRKLNKKVKLLKKK